MEPSRWLLHDDHPTGEPHRVHRWWLVLWLTGVDYFSTLGYQPGIALLAAGALAPLATALLVAVTLLGALPVYSQVAARSYAGQGSIAMLENLLPGWLGKLLVLALLGFAATDFVITITLSAADATQHAIENPFLHPYLDEARVAVTLGLIALLALVFLQGFAEAIGVATLVAIPYLGLNLIVLGRGLWEILRHPELMESWRAGLFTVHGDWTGLLVASALIFPRLALGMSGFETGVSVMPLVAGSSSDGPAPRAPQSGPGNTFFSTMSRPLGGSLRRSIGERPTAAYVFSAPFFVSCWHHPRALPSFTAPTGPRSSGSSMGTPWSWTSTSG